MFEILLEFTRSQSWESAFYKVIPGRKVQHFKNACKDTGDDKSTEDVETVQGADMDLKLSENEEDKLQEDDMPKIDELNTDSAGLSQNTSGSTQQNQVAAQSEVLDQEEQTLTWS